MQHFLFRKMDVPRRDQAAEAEVVSSAPGSREKKTDERAASANVVKGRKRARQYSHRRRCYTEIITLSYYNIFVEQRTEIGARSQVIFNLAQLVLPVQEKVNRTADSHDNEQVL